MGCITSLISAEVESFHSKQTEHFELGHFSRSDRQGWRQPMFYGTQVRGLPSGDVSIKVERRSSHLLQIFVTKVSKELAVSSCWGHKRLMYFAAVESRADLLTHIFWKIYVHLGFGINRHPQFHERRIGDTVEASLQ
uniref:Uncharacterized protein n=1 Tax=Physcomitrium patens TaxID=3218 RepID=A0A2K1J316_PHYPA|nr:hypothetical protein PHYPA_021766 [Physcomitrium patens]